MYPFPNIAHEIATKIFILGTTANCLMTELTGSLQCNLWDGAPRKKDMIYLKLVNIFFSWKLPLHCGISVGGKDTFRTSLGNESEVKMEEETWCIKKDFRDPSCMRFKQHLMQKPQYQIRSDQISSSVVSDSFRPHESQHARPPCPSPTPTVHSNLRPLSQWCHPANSSSVVPFSSCPQSLPASESFPMSQLFAIYEAVKTTVYIYYIGSN